jgi:hypothetical protein
MSPHDSQYNPPCEQLDLLFDISPGDIGSIHEQSDNSHLLDMDFMATLGIFEVSMP